MIKFDTLKEAARFRVVESEDNYWVEDYWYRGCSRHGHHEYRS